MRNLSPTDLINFRSSSDRSKATFALNLKKVKMGEEVTGGGGNYWISSLSTISNIYRSGKMNLIDEKIEYLQDKIVEDADNRINDRHQRNIKFLNDFKNFNFDDIKPAEHLNYHRKTEANSVLEINELPIKLMPHHLFSFGSNQKEIGAVWFVAKLEGYQKDELGIFSDLLFRYLTKHFSAEFLVNNEQCIAVEIGKHDIVRYSEIENGNVASLIDGTIDGIKKIL